jgi:hypothetical protein
MTGEFPHQTDRIPVRALIREVDIDSPREQDDVDGECDVHGLRRFLLAI